MPHHSNGRIEAAAAEGAAENLAVTSEEQTAANLPASLDAVVAYLSLLEGKNAE